MAWVYQQSTGEMHWPPLKIGQGYAGKGEDKNNPASQEKRELGPIPRGRYIMSEPFDHSKCGPYFIPLIPDRGNVMFGRAGFGCHGDSIEEPGNASDGCIIMPREVRERMWISGDKLLEVVA